MGFKIVVKLFGAHYYCITNFFYFRIVSCRPASTFETKYTGNCCFIILPFFVIFLSCTRALLAAECVVET
jgi:hypothetical protein